MRWVNSSSICARLGVLQCKVVHRVHWSKSKLAHIYPDIDPKCDKCRQRPANLSHMFWSCPTHAPFWTCVFDSLSGITSANIHPHHYSPCLKINIDAIIFFHFSAVTVSLFFYGQPSQQKTAAEIRSSVIDQCEDILTSAVKRLKYNINRINAIVNSRLIASNRD